MQLNFDSFGGALVCELSLLLMNDWPILMEALEVRFTGAMTFTARDLIRPLRPIHKPPTISDVFADHVGESARPAFLHLFLGYQRHRGAKCGHGFYG